MTFRRLEHGKWAALTRLNVGCGGAVVPGWINCDVRRIGIDVCGDVRGQLPLASNTMGAIAAIHGDSDWFYVPDRDARSAGAKLTTQIIWYGSVHTPMTFGFVSEWMERAGFRSIERRPFGQSRIPELASLDNRARESMFVEGVKSNGPPAAGC